MDEMWVRSKSAALFAVLSATLVAANVDTARRIRAIQPNLRAGVLLANEVAGSVAVAVLVLLPWVLGGIDPTREDLTWAILLSFAAAVASVFVLVISVFDLAGAGDPGDGLARRAGAPGADSEDGQS